MAFRAIIDKNNRVIITSTTDDNYALDSSRQIAVTTNKWSSLPFTYNKLDVDNVTILQATDDEAADAGINTDKLRERKIADKAALIDVLTRIEGSSQAALIKELATKLKKYLG